MHINIRASGIHVINNQYITLQQVNVYTGGLLGLYYISFIN